MRTLFCCLSLLAVATHVAAREITPCDLTPHAFEDQLVTISARALFTMHGAYLLGSSCTGKGQYSAALLLPGEKGSPLVSFELDPSSLASLKPFFRTTGGQAFACGLFSGRVFYKKGFRLRHFDEITIGNGFGEHGTLQAGFVIESVKDVRACD